MIATAAVRHRVAALVLATAALGGSAAVAAVSSSAAPAVHAVAMYKENPDGCRPVVGDPGFHVSDAYVPGYVCP
jgi:uncharacterized protein with ACT and thioredoxin-like domain